MPFALSGTVITQTGASAGSRDTPAGLSGISGVTVSGRHVFIDADLVINGFYNDTGWTYTFASGYNLRKGSSCDWISGDDDFGNPIEGFVCNVQGASTASLNQSTGGNVTWYNVRFNNIGTSRFDFSMHGTSGKTSLDAATNWDIDGLEILQRQGSHVRFLTTSGDITNVTVSQPSILVLSDVVSNIRATSFRTTDTAGTETNLREVARIEVFEDDQVLVGYDPTIRNSFQRLGSNFYWNGGSDSRRTTTFQDMVTPDTWDWDRDFYIFGGNSQAHVIATRQLSLNFFDDAGDPLSNVRAVFTNTADNDSGVLSDPGQNQLLDISGDSYQEQVTVFIGHKNNGTNAYQRPGLRSNRQVKSFYFFQYGRVSSRLLNIDMSSESYANSIFMLTDSNISETNIATVNAYTDFTPQQLYDRSRAFIFNNSLITVNDIITRNENQINAGSFNFVVLIDYSTAETYAVNDYAFQAGNIYRCTTAVTSPQAFNSSSWTQVGTGAFHFDGSTVFARITGSNMDLTTTGTLTLPRPRVNGNVEYQYEDATSESVVLALPAVDRNSIYVRITNSDNTVTTLTGNDLPVYSTHLNIRKVKNRNLQVEIQDYNYVNFTRNYTAQTFETPALMSRTFAITETQARDLMGTGLSDLDGKWFYVSGTRTLHIDRAIVTANNMPAISAVISEDNLDLLGDGEELYSFINNDTTRIDLEYNVTLVGTGSSNISFIDLGSYTLSGNADFPYSDSTGVSITYNVNTGNRLTKALVGSTEHSVTGGSLTIRSVPGTSLTTRFKALGYLDFSTTNTVSATGDEITVNMIEITRLDGTASYSGTLEGSILGITLNESNNTLTITETDNITTEDLNAQRDTLYWIDYNKSWTETDQISTRHDANGAAFDDVNYTMEQTSTASLLIPFLRQAGGTYQNNTSNPLRNAQQTQIIENNVTVTASDLDGLADSVWSATTRTLTSGGGGGDGGLTDAQAEQLTDIQEESKSILSKVNEIPLGLLQGFTNLGDLTEWGVTFTDASEVEEFNINDNTLDILLNNISLTSASIQTNFVDFTDFTFPNNNNEKFIQIKFRFENQNNSSTRTEIEVDYNIEMVDAGNSVLVVNTPVRTLKLDAGDAFITENLYLGEVSSGVVDEVRFYFTVGESTSSDRVRLFIEPVAVFEKIPRTISDFHGFTPDDRTALDNVESATVTNRLTNLQTDLDAYTNKDDWKANLNLLEDEINLNHARIIDNALNGHTLITNVGDDNDPFALDTVASHSFEGQSTVTYDSSDRESRINLNNQTFTTSDNFEVKYSIPARTYAEGDIIIFDVYNRNTSIDNITIEFSLFFDGNLLEEREVIFRSNITRRRIEFRMTSEIVVNTSEWDVRLSGFSNPINGETVAIGLRTIGVYEDRLVGEVEAIQAKTDNLTFNSDNELLTDVQKTNGNAVQDRLAERSEVLTN